MGKEEQRSVDTGTHKKSEKAKNKQTRNGEGGKRKEMGVAKGVAG